MRTIIISVKDSSWKHVISEASLGSVLAQSICPLGSRILTVRLHIEFDVSIIATMWFIQMIGERES